MKDTTTQPSPMVFIRAYAGERGEVKVEISPLARVDDLFKAFEKQFENPEFHFGIYQNNSGLQGWHSRIGYHHMTDELTADQVGENLRNMTVFDYACVFGNAVQFTWYLSDKSASYIPPPFVVTAYSVFTTKLGEVEISPLSRVDDLFKAFEKQFENFDCHFGIYPFGGDKIKDGWHSRIGYHNQFDDLIPSEQVKEKLSKMTVCEYAGILKTVTIVKYMPDKR